MYQNFMENPMMRLYTLVEDRKMCILRCFYFFVKYDVKKAHFQPFLADFCTLSVYTCMQWTYFIKVHELESIKGQLNRNTAQNVAQKRSNSPLNGKKWATIGLPDNFKSLCVGLYEVKHTLYVF